MSPKIIVGIGLSFCPAIEDFPVGGEKHGRKNRKENKMCIFARLNLSEDGYISSNTSV
jgi:hypothetical protein